MLKMPAAECCWVIWGMLISTQPITAKSLRSSIDISGYAWWHHFDALAVAIKFRLAAAKTHNFPQLYGGIWLGCLPKYA